MLQFRRTGQKPLVDGPQINDALASFKVINVGITNFGNGLAVTWEKLGSLSAKGDGRLGFGFNKRQSVNHLRDERNFFLVIEIRSQHPVVHWLIAYVDFLCQWPFPQVHHRRSNGQFITELVIKTTTDHGLELHVEQ